MAQKKFDGVIETVQYSADGLIAMVRFYERRGPTFSDHMLLDRSGLLARIKEGKKFFTGKRVPYMGSIFELDQPVRVINVDGKDYVVTDESNEAGDNLGSLPVI